MEHEIVNKETPEMKQLISGIKEVSKRLREIAQTHPAVRGRNLPHGARGLRTAFHQSSHLAGLSGQGHYPLHPNRRENTLSPLRHQQTASRKLSLHQLYKKIGENLISIYFYLFSQFLERVFIFTISDP